MPAGNTWYTVGFRCVGACCDMPGIAFVFILAALSPQPEQTALIATTHDSRLLQHHSRGADRGYLLTGPGPLAAYYLVVFEKLVDIYTTI